MSTLSDGNCRAVLQESQCGFHVAAMCCQTVEQRAIGGRRLHAEESRTLQFSGLLGHRPVGTLLLLQHAGSP
jgi:hypothetical protein